MASESESGTEYEVVKILQQRRRKGIVEYLVRWSGFGPQEDSWEPEKSLTDCKRLINDFNNFSKSSAKKTTKRTSRSRSSSRSRSRSRGRSRSSSRSRKSPARSKAVNTTPARESTTTVRSSRKSTAGTIEEKTSTVTKSTVEEVKPDLSNSRRTEVKQTITTVTTSSSSRPDTVVATEKKAAWQFPRVLVTSDVPVMIIFTCVALIALSFILEKYVDFEAVWQYICSLCAAAVASVKNLASKAGSSAPKGQ